MIIVESSFPSEMGQLQGFEELGLHEDVILFLKKEGLLLPTPTQRRFLWSLRNTEQVLYKAPTGSGKTVCTALFLASSQIPANGFCLFVCPTRELKSQVFVLLKSMVNHKRVIQKYDGINDGILVTDVNPPRSIRAIDTLIVDEVDIGFKFPKVRNLMTNPEIRRKIFFGATIPKIVGKNIINDCFNTQRRYIWITCGANKPSCTVDYEFIEIKDDLELQLLKLCGLLIQRGRIAIAAIGSDTAAAISIYLNSMSYDVVPLLTEDEEVDEKLLHFQKQGEILVCETSLLRGLDFDDLFAIILLEPPGLLNDFIHVSGRVGRCGRKGKVITFYDDSSSQHIASIKAYLK